MTAVWSIAGSDSSAGAGIQADLKTFHDFNVYGCTVITALTAQNTQGVADIQPSSPENIQAQITALQSDVPPDALKLGMLYCLRTIEIVSQTLIQLSCPVIADPVLVSTSGAQLYSNHFIEAYKKHILPLVTLLTPNTHECKMLTGHDINHYEDMKTAADKLLALGAKAVLIKGGDFKDENLACDFYADAHQTFWLNQNRIPANKTHGTGCTLSAAITAALAQGWPLLDAIILAKAYVHAGITHAHTIGAGARPINHPGTQSLSKHFPWITDTPAPLASPFKTIKQPMGRYPIVDNLHELEQLCTKGIQFIQLRIKKPGSDFDAICKQAQTITNLYHVNLIVNDDKVQAQRNHTGLHLGQEDLSNHDLLTLPRNIYLGLSAHNLFELAKAYAYHPSYLAMGPVFETRSKKLAYHAIGLQKLKCIASLSPLPLVAIGGISYEKLTTILETGCSGAAFIAASKAFINDGRFDRHFSLPNFNAQSQQRLLTSKIVCIGVGGLAAGFLPYLAAAGVGHITLIDADNVSYSNLQRQVLFKESDIGKPKVQAAQAYLRALNTSMQVNTIQENLSVDNAVELLSGHDLIIDGTDNYAAHYLINDMARYLNKDLIAASVYQDQGQLFYINRESACYRCAFPEAPPLHSRPNCNTAGVLGTTPGLMGMMQAQLAIACLTQHIKTPKSFCKAVNMSNWAVKKFELTLAKNCPSCQDSISMAAIRNINMATTVTQITSAELKALLDAGKPVNLLDVREDHEREEFNIGGIHIPIQDLPERVYELDPNVPYVVYCRSGNRSTMACEFLMGQNLKVKNLQGGMIGWQEIQ